MKKIRLELALFDSLTKSFDGWGDFILIDHKNTIFKTVADKTANKRKAQMKYNEIRKDILVHLTRLILES